MRRKPSEKLQDIGEHVGRIAHELSAPVGLIAGSLENLDQYVGALVRYVAASECRVPDDAELHRLRAELALPYVVEHAPALVDICSEGARRLAHVVDQLKGFMRARPAGAAATAVSLAALVSEAITFAAQGRAVRPHVRSALSGLPCVAADHAALSQALVNVIGNAFDAVAAAAEPQVWITARAGASENGASDRRGWVEMRIRDNGPGIPAANRASVFEPFFTTKARGAGLGLGLAIAREMIESQGGALELAPSQGGGAEFIIRLPQAG